MRIDAHQHFWALERGDYGWLTRDLAPIHRDFGPRDLQRHLTEASIDRTILVQAAPTAAETAYLLSMARDVPFVAGVVGWVDFDSPDVAEQIARVASDPLLVGLRPMIQDIPDPEWMTSSRVDSAVRAVARHGLVFDALVKPMHLQPLLVLAERRPEVSIVIDHLAKPNIPAGDFEVWSHAMERLSRLPNTAVKLSGLLTEAGAAGPQSVRPYIRRAMEMFGPARVLFGSDWPVLNLAGTYSTWLAMVEDELAAWPAAARAGVMGENAARIYLSGRGRR